MRHLFYFAFLFFVLLAFFIFTSGCSLHDTNDENQTLSHSVDDFPNDIGTRWTYNFYDSISHSSDMVIVSIVGKTSFDNFKIANIWDYSWNTKNDSQYVNISGDTVRIFENLKSLWTNTKFIFPFEVGKDWHGDFASDKSLVIGIDSITVPAGYFKESYQIEESWGAFNDYGYVISWFVPQIGIVKKIKKQWGFGFISESWEMVSYEFP